MRRVRYGCVRMPPMEELLFSFQFEKSKEIEVFFKKGMEARMSHDGELKPFRYTKLKDISPEHKIKVFDKIYSRCLEHAKGHFEDDEMFCHTDCDCQAYIAEAAMMGCLGENVYDQLNEYEDYVLED